MYERHVNDETKRSVTRNLFQIACLAEGVR
jgi:hypothetical protein